MSIFHAFHQIYTALCPFFEYIFILFMKTTRISSIFWHMFKFVMLAAKYIIVASLFFWKHGLTSNFCHSVFEVLFHVFYQTRTFLIEFVWHIFILFVKITIPNSVFLHIYLCAFLTRIWYEIISPCFFLVCRNHYNFMAFCRYTLTLFIQITIPLNCF